MIAAIAAQPAVTKTATSVLILDVDGRRSALLAEVVIELHRMVAVVPLPGAPAVVDGVIDVRGAVVAVIDLRARFGLPVHPPMPSEHLVLARANDRMVALRADRVLDLVEIPSAAIASARELAPGPNLSGVAVLEDGLLLIHDVDAFLSEHEVAVLDGALAERRRSSGGEP